MKQICHFDQREKSRAKSRKKIALQIKADFSLNARNDNKLKIEKVIKQSLKLL